MKEKKKADYMKDVLVSLFGGYGITFLGIVLLAVLLLLLQISENVVDIGILAIYVLSCLAAGWIVGKRTKNKKFLWGMVSGSVYFLILFIISLMANQSMEKVGNDLLTTLCICLGSGTLGGMIS